MAPAVSKLRPADLAGEWGGIGKIAPCRLPDYETSDDEGDVFKDVVGFWLSLKVKPDGSARISLWDYNYEEGRKGRFVFISSAASFDPSGAFILPRPKENIDIVIEVDPQSGTGTGYIKPHGGQGEHCKVAMGGKK